MASRSITISLSSRGCSATPSLVRGGPQDPLTSQTRRATMDHNTTRTQPGASSSTTIASKSVRSIAASPRLTSCPDGPSVGGDRLCGARDARLCPLSLLRDLYANLYIFGVLSRSSRPFRRSHFATHSSCREGFARLACDVCQPETTLALPWTSTRRPLRMARRPTCCDPG